MITYGFYNSKSGDRMYSTSQISDFLDGLIKDGIFAPISDGNHHGFQVVALATPVMSVNVSIGKAWFKGTWTKIDSAYEVEIPTASALLSRIDAIVLTINKTRESRSNYIEVISGNESSSNPRKPDVQNESNIYRYVLAYVTVAAGATRITQANIEDNIGVEGGVPFVDLANPLGEDYPTTDELLLQYKSQFDEWFDYMKNQLTTDAAGRLQTEIDNVGKLYTGVLTTGHIEGEPEGNLITLDNLQDFSFGSSDDGSIFIIRYVQQVPLDSITTNSNGIVEDINMLGVVISFNMHNVAVYSAPNTFIFKYDHANECFDLISIGNIDTTPGGTTDSPNLITSGAVKAGISAEATARTDAINALRQDFTDGCNAIANALIAKGITPTKSGENYTPLELENAILLLLGPLKRTVQYSYTMQTVERGHWDDGTHEYKNVDNILTMNIGSVTKTFTYNHTYIVGSGKPWSMPKQTWTQEV